jgi:transcriptional regulator with XRE-family HTH domain
MRIAYLASTVKRRRRAADLTLRELADRIGIGHSTLDRIERAVGTPDTSTVLALCEWMGMPLERFAEQSADRLHLYAGEPVIEHVCATIWADQHLSDPVKDKLSCMMATVYNVVTQGENVVTQG